MDIMTALNWLGAIIIALGGTTAVVTALAKWFGDMLANKLLEKDRLDHQEILEEIKSKYSSSLEKDKRKYQEELEEIKKEYQKELDAKKAELEKSKALFFRYSEHQFTLYNDLWKNLICLKFLGEELWKEAKLDVLQSFSKQLRKAKLSVEDSALLIEDAHYEELLEILKNFGEFEVGKTNLISLRNIQPDEIGNAVHLPTAEDIIAKNGDLKEQFTDLLGKLSKSFKKQIKGY